MHTLDYFLTKKSIRKRKSEKKIQWPPVRGGKEKNELELSVKGRINYLFQVCVWVGCSLYLVVSSRYLFGLEITYTGSFPG